MTLALAGLACAASVVLLWRGDRPDTAVVRAHGKVVAEVALSETRTLEVEGALGISRVEIQPGRARVMADPGPRQYCVRQGWLSRSGAVAICAPNQVSLTLRGRGGDHDTLSY